MQPIQIWFLTPPEPIYPPMEMHSNIWKKGFMGKHSSLRLADATIYTPPKISATWHRNLQSCASGKRWLTPVVLCGGGGGGIYTIIQSLKYRKTLKSVFILRAEGWGWAVHSGLEVWCTSSHYKNMSELKSCTCLHMSMWVSEQCSNGRRWPGLLNHIFYYILRTTALW